MAVLDGGAAWFTTKEKFLDASLNDSTTADKQTWAGGTDHDMSSRHLFLGTWHGRADTGSTFIQSYWRAQHDGGAAALPGDIADNSATHDNRIIADLHLGNTWVYSMFYSTIFESSTSTDDWALYQQGGGPGDWLNIHSVLIDLSGLTSGEDYVYAQSGADASATSTATNRASLASITPVAEEDWIILVSGKYALNTTDGRGVSLRLYDGTNVRISERFATGETAWAQWSNAVGYLWEPPDTTAKTFHYRDVRIGSSNRLGYFHNIHALRVKSLGVNYAKAKPTGTWSPTAADTTELVSDGSTDAEVTLTAQDNGHLVLAFFTATDLDAGGEGGQFDVWIDTGSGSNPLPTNRRSEETDGDLLFATTEDGEDMGHIIFAVDGSPTGDTTYRLYARSKTGTSLTFKDIALVAIEIGSTAAAGGGGSSSAGNVARLMAGGPGQLIKRGG